MKLLSIGLHAYPTKKLAWLLLAAALSLAGCGGGGGSEVGSDPGSGDQDTSEGGGSGGGNTGGGGSEGGNTDDGSADGGNSDSNITGTGALRPVFGFKNPKSGATILTGSHERRNQILASSPSLDYLGREFYFRDTVDGTLPVYDLTRGEPHRYTTSTEVRDELVRSNYSANSADFRAEGTSDANSVAVNEFENPAISAFTYLTETGSPEPVSDGGTWRSLGPAFQSPAPNIALMLGDSNEATPVRWITLEPLDLTPELHVSNPFRNDGFVRVATGNQVRDAVLVPDQIIDTTSGRMLDPHIAYVLTIENGRFWLLDLRLQGVLAWRQVSAETSAEKGCFGSEDRPYLVQNFADVSKSVYRYGVGISATICEQREITLDMSATDNPVRLESGLLLEPVYSADGSPSGRLEMREERVNNSTRSFIYRTGPDTDASGKMILALGDRSSAFSADSLLHRRTINDPNGTRFLVRSFGETFHRGIKGVSGYGGAGISFIGIGGDNDTRLFGYRHGTDQFVELSQPPVNGFKPFVFDRDTGEGKALGGEAIAYDATHVYWLDTNGLWRTSLSFDAAPERVLEQQGLVPPVLLGSGRVVFHRQNQGGDRSAIWSIPKSGGTPTLLAETVSIGGSMRGLWVQDDNLFFNRTDYAGTQSEAYSGIVPIDGGAQASIEPETYWVGWAQRFETKGDQPELSRLFKLRALQQQRQQDNLYEFDLESVSLNDPNHNGVRIGSVAATGKLVSDATYVERQVNAGAFRRYKLVSGKVWKEITGEEMIHGEQVFLAGRSAFGIDGALLDRDGHAAGPTIPN